MRLSCVLHAAVLLLLVMWTGTLRAQPVLLDLEACPVPPADEVRSLASLELKERLTTAASEDALHLQVSCSELRAELSVRETGARRSLSLTSVPEALRARLLALSIAELASAREEPAEAAPAPPEQEEPETVRASRTAARPASHAARYLMSLGGELQAAPLLAGQGALSLVWRARRWLSLAGALSAGQTRTSLDRGTLRVRQLSLRVGPALTLELQRSLLQLGVGARAGLLWLAGEPDEPRAASAAQFRSWYIGPALFAGWLLRLGAHGLITLELELAHRLRRVRADVEGGGARTLSALRPSAQLGVGATW